jgi:hypothetical protein
LGQEKLGRDWIDFGSDPCRSVLDWFRSGKDGLTGVGVKRSGVKVGKNTRGRYPSSWSGYGCLREAFADYGSAGQVLA